MGRIAEFIKEAMDTEVEDDEFDPEAYAADYTEADAAADATAEATGGTESDIEGEACIDSEAEMDFDFRLPSDDLWFFDWNKVGFFRRFTLRGYLVRLAICLAILAMVVAIRQLAFSNIHLSLLSPFGYELTPFQSVVYLSCVAAGFCALDFGTGMDDDDPWCKAIVALGNAFILLATQVVFSTFEHLMTIVVALLATEATLGHKSPFFRNMPPRNQMRARSEVLPLVFGLVFWGAYILSILIDRLP